MQSLSAPEQASGEADRTTARPALGRELPVGVSLGSRRTAASRSAPADSLQQRNSIRLQKTIGNQAVLRMLSRRAPAVQKKLIVNKPGDRYEQEADQVADRVLRTQDHVPASQGVAVDTPGAGAPRPGQVRERVLREPDGDISAIEPPIVHDVLNSPGLPLPLDARAFLEPRFGRDFSQTRIHTDTQAADASRAIHARAFTAGNHLGFAAGEHALSTAPGMRLLAHELTHVVQQMPNEPGARSPAGLQSCEGAAPSSMVQRQSDDNAAVGNAATLDQQYRAALQAARSTGNYQDAAEKLNGFNYEDIQNRLAELSDNEVGYLHGGAVDNPRVGPQSQVALMTVPDRPRASLPAPAASAAAPPPKTAQAPTPVPTPAPAAGAKSIADMAPEDKLIEAYNRADIGAAVRDKIGSLITPKALVLAILGFAAAFVVSQLTPVGWAADLGIALTALFIGSALVSCIDHLINFAAARNATTNAELDRAGAEFAAAIAEFEIDALILLVTHGLGGEGGAPMEGPPPPNLAFATNRAGALVVVAAGTIPAEQAAQIGLKGAAMMSQLGSGSGGTSGNQAPQQASTPQASTPQGAAGQPGSTGEILSETRVGGKTVIKSRVGFPPGERLGTEKLLPRGVEVGREGWQRAHSQGQITGAESGAGILLAPEEVNQGLQRTGIEQFISDLNSQKAADTTIFMTTETEAHSGTLALKSITYRIEAARAGGRPTILYEAEITVENKVENPNITVSADQLTDETPFLKSTPSSQ